MATGGVALVTDGVAGSEAPAVTAVAAGLSLGEHAVNSRPAAAKRAHTARLGRRLEAK